MEKAFEIQRAARENVQDVKSFMTDLGNWEKEMKRKEAALQGKSDQDLPPVRSKLKKERPVAQVTKTVQPRIKGSDYNLWDKFDVEAACGDVDMSGVGPTSLDSRRSEEVKQSKMREEAQYEKDRGNGFVKQEKWDEATECYNRAIELVNNDAIYYANRGLCHLKKDRLRQAESDCTEAIKLDSTYVKAYQRRAAAREKLGSLRSASQDLATVIQLEPNNSAARRQLAALRERMATKGGKVKSSPTTTPTEAAPPEIPNRPKIVELPDEPPKLLEPLSTKLYSPKEKKSALDKWLDGTLDNVQVVQPVDKPPHLRSKKQMRQIKIEEVLLGDTVPKKTLDVKPVQKLVPEPVQKPVPEPVQKLVPHSVPEPVQKPVPEPVQKLVPEPVQKPVPAIADDGSGDSLRPSEKALEKNIIEHSSPKDNVKSSLVKEVCKKESNENEKNNNIDTSKLTPPTTCVQFMAEWKSYKDNVMARIAYLNVIKSDNYRGIFQNSLESEVLSEILHTLAVDPRRHFAKRVAPCLRGLTNVRRFGALAMFLSSEDRRVVKDLLQYCKEHEDCGEEELNDLRNKFEL